MFPFAFFAPPSAATHTINANVCPQPLTTVISSPVNNSTTKTNTTTMSGTTYATSSVAVTDNGNPLATVTSDDAGSFSVSLPLVSGKNVLNAHITNICGVTADVSVTVIYTAPPIIKPHLIAAAPAPKATTTTKIVTPQPAPAPAPATEPAPTPAPEPTPDKPLEIKITSPPSHSTTKLPGEYVIGTTNQPAIITITVNGQIAAKFDTPSTSFRVRIPLEGGDNVIAVQATTDQHTASTSVIVHRDGKAVTTNTTPGTSTRSWMQSSTGKLVLATAALGIIIAIILIEIFL